MAARPPKDPKKKTKHPTAARSTGAAVRRTPTKAREAKGQSLRASDRPSSTGPAKPRGKKAKAATPPPKRRSALRWVLKWGSVGAIWGAVLLFMVVAYHAYDLPDISHLETPTRSPSTTVATMDGTVLASYGDLHSGYVDVSDLPSVLPNAVMAIEDRRFRDHFGIDPLGLLRAAVVNVMEGAVVQGGSTITQQLAKNLFLSPERTLHRKIQEVLLALWLEHRFSKDQILTLYLNRVYLGAGAYGVEAASQRYFGKSARRVSLPEAAMLAGLLKAPSRYAPTRDLDLARARAAQVLDAMVADGAISAEEAAEAKARPASPGGSTAGNGFYYFADWTVEQVPGFVGGEHSDVTVTTTLDPVMQRAAAAAVAEVLSQDGERLGAGQAALVAMTPDGAVKAMVGGRSYAESQFNRATQARRQPGSAFKLFVYLAALEAGFAPTDRIVDQPVTVNGWTPDNYHGKYRGAIDLVQAFAVSSNSAAVQLAEQVGIGEVAATARRLGVVSPLTETPSLALGTSEVTLVETVGAYAAIANGGHAVLPYGIAAVTDRNGIPLYQRGGSGGGQVLAPETVSAMARMMRAVVTEGTGKAAAVDGLPAAGKTGTSQDFRDAWFVGYVPGLVVGVWVGNDDSSAMKNVTGGTLPAIIWRRFVTAVR
ncbi:MAG: penicillin-binding protein [Rhodospirillaceae bacterium]|nr:penicillin-binding protein [Rhodospirillaceae bacterium]